MAKQELETSKHDLEDVKAHLQSQLGASMEAARSHDTNMQKMHLELQVSDMSLLVQQCFKTALLQP